MNRFLDLFEKAIVIVLIVIMALIITLATIILGWAILSYVLSSPDYLADSPELLDILGYVLLVLIGIELLETVKAYLSEHIIHVEVVMEVAIIALARKVIVLDFNEYSSLTILAIAALILALSVGFFLEKRARLLGARLTND